RGNAPSHAGPRSSPRTDRDRTAASAATAVDPSSAPATADGSRCSAQRPAEEADGLGERLIGRFGIEPRALVAHEGVLCRIVMNGKRSTFRPQRVLDLRPSLGGNVRILSAPHEQQWTANLARALQRSGVGVAPELAVVDTGAVEADGRLHVRLKRG